MPLIHSKKPEAFKKNVETEMEHGKPQKQAVAIAYHEADEAKEHKDEGGEMESDEDLHDMVGKEMMDAIHSKDHKKMMSGLEAMVLSCMNKRGEE